MLGSLRDLADPEDGRLAPPNNHLVGAGLPGYFMGQTSLVAQMVKHLPTMRKTRVQSLGWEDPLEKAMASHSSILAWKIPWMEEPGRLQSMGSQGVGYDCSLSFTSRVRDRERLRKQKTIQQQELISLPYSPSLVGGSGYLPEAGH